MLLILLLIIPLIGTILVSTNSNTGLASVLQTSGTNTSANVSSNYKNLGILNTGLASAGTSSKKIGLITSIVNLFVSIVVFLLFNFSSNQYQFVQEYHSINNIDFYLGVDGISMYFVLLTTIIMPIAILSN